MGRRRSRIFVSTTAGLALSACACGAAAAASLFNPVDKIDKNFKCPEASADLVIDRVDQILKSEVIAAIEKQIQDAKPEAKAKPVTVKIYFVDLAEFTKELNDDGNKGLDAKNLFEKFDAFTYAPNADRTDTVKIKIFCKAAIREDAVDNDRKHGLDRKFVHELVHAKVIAMQDVGEKPPFKETDDKDDPPPKDRPGDHSGGFSKEVDALMKKLPK